MNLLRSYCSYDLKNIIIIYVVLLQYEDEYDDTYDGHAVGCEEPDAHNGEFVVPRVLRSKADDDDDEEEEEENEEEENTNKPRDEFVANPAVLREQAQQRWISRMSRRGHGRGPGGPPPRRDVVGMYLLVNLLSIIHFIFIVLMKGLKL